MSEHDELADVREREADELEHESERNAELADQARDALEQANRDELTPAAMGEEDPARREPTEAEGEQSGDERESESD